MTATLLQVLLAPALVAAATLAGRRWGDRTAGLVSAFPAIVGPVLLLDAHAHGAAFAARAAAATLLGVSALAAFMVAYAHAARRAGWPVALAAGWVAAGALALPAATGGGAGLAASLAVAVGSLAAAALALPAAGARVTVVLPRWELPARMLLTLALVAALAAPASELGAVAGGVLAALPVLAAVLAVATHRSAGPDAVAALLRGMAAGMSGFVAFCAAFALLAEPLGAPGAFAVAAAAAAGAQALASAPGMATRRVGVLRRHAHS